MRCLILNTHKIQAQRHTMLTRFLRLDVDARCYFTTSFLATTHGYQLPKPGSDGRKLAKND
ncbi:LOW QUALITY PROTEIN: hypothetical protein PHMEG_00025559 [Phytophthora megakarya]|uniref:Uncharacterized protein n=1 Tax=Phytophthora megakarya TaxID=4795 RepID=A0A225VBQ9_9STRA|nr:LOW QUALITY PROTEIN: hypothetical protein PHMEG_00025559 [Phytophthora megakarya]